VETTNNQSIELAGDRVVSFTDRGQPLAYIFRRIEEIDWKQFFNGLVFESEREGNERVDRFDMKTAGLAMVDSCLVDVKGYSFAGDRPLEKKEGWAQHLPYGHRVKAASLLQDVIISRVSREFVIYPDVEEVVIAAKWGYTQPGTMTQFDGLLHRFAQPTAEHLRRYNRAMSETRVVTTGHSSRTVHAVRQPLLMEMYDQLIQSVDGYQISGQPLGSNIMQIRSNMDAAHKVVAVQQLFTPVGEAQAAIAN
jgi:hypothetical protein